MYRITGGNLFGRQTRAVVQRVDIEGDRRRNVTQSIWALGAEAWSQRGRGKFAPDLPSYVFPHAALEWILLLGDKRQRECIKFTSAAYPRRATAKLLLKFFRIDRAAEFRHWCAVEFGRGHVRRGDLALTLGPHYSLELALVHSVLDKRGFNGGLDRADLFAIVLTVVASQFEPILLRISDHGLQERSVVRLHHFLHEDHCRSVHVNLAPVD